MNRNFIVSSALFISVFVGGCSVDESPGSSAPGQATISDDEIDSYSAWWHAQLDLGRKQVREMNELHERLDSKYSLADLHKVQEDPELLAMIARHRDELMEHKDNTPIPREKAEGFDSVLAGIGRTVNRDGRTVYEVYHDESALRGARGRYGDKFVDKVLSRENDIAAAMNP